MKIHLIETDKKPVIGTIIKANCGEEIIFKESITVNYMEDGRLCEKCHNNHMNTQLQSKTYAHPKWEDGEK